MLRKTLFTLIIKKETKKRYENYKMIDLEEAKLLHAQKSSGAGGITYGLVSVQRSSSGFSRCLLLKRADDFDE